MVTRTTCALTMCFQVAASEEMISNKRIAFTTPSNYACRLSHLLHLRGWNPLWCPTVIVETTTQTKESIKSYLSVSEFQDFSAIAFTSRTGISSFSETLLDLDIRPLTRDTFIISALGKDAELVNEDFVSKLCDNPNRVRVIVPPVATPLGLVESLGVGLGRRILCPVPMVIGLHEPPVIPDFLLALAANGWVPVKVYAYETRWAGPNCAQVLLQTQEDELDALVFTSTGEVEGLLKSLKEVGFDWETVRKRWPSLVVAAHGPVTAAGAHRLGVTVDVVSSSFGSFDGIVEALLLRFGASNYFFKE